MLAGSSFCWVWSIVAAAVMLSIGQEASEVLKIEEEAMVESGQ